jgi:pimeloyl-ACP methyl ester carboxylesterase
VTYHYLDVPGGRLAYQTSGSGERAVVWLPGLPLDSRAWQYQRRHFDTRARNAFVDLRGYGRSGSCRRAPRTSPTCIWRTSTR